MTKKNQAKLDRLRDDYAKVNSLWNLGNHREQILRLSFIKLTAQGKKISNSKLAAAAKLRAKLEGYAREREKIARQIQKLTGG